MSGHLLLSFTAFFFLGTTAGLLSGMLGIGGGIIIVPGLLWIFHLYHFPDDVIMQMAAGTSLAVMAVSMARALLAHRRYHIEYFSIYKRWFFPVVLGVLLGVVFAHYLQSNVLGIIFGGFVILLSLKLLLPQSTNKDRSLPGNVAISIYGLIVGGISGLLGVGGGSLTVPFLVHCNVAMRRSVVISIAVGLTIAVIGTIMTIAMGWGVKGLPPHTIGYVYWPAWLGLVVSTIIFVPLGVVLSHRLPVTILKRMLACVLIFVGLHLLIHYR